MASSSQYEITIVNQVHYRDVNIVTNLNNSDYNDNSPSKSLVFYCPHCDGTIVVDEKDVNCGIFRHGHYNGDDRNGLKKWQPLQPHETESNIIYLCDNNMINGCGKPIMLSSDKKQVFTCKYI
jgi:hypothetical protein